MKIALQTEIRKLFGLKKKVTAIGAPDAQNVFLRAPYLQYKQIRRTENFRQYLEKVMLSSKVLWMGVQKTLY